MEIVTCHGNLSCQNLTRNKPGACGSGKIPSAWSVLIRTGMIVAILWLTVCGDPSATPCEWHRLLSLKVQQGTGQATPASTLSQLISIRMQHNAAASSGMEDQDT
mmetsp:Transcript_95266/g.188793  ORF Transcript_95266/g.188793 Transcript_95266/m.188793 type:complete len:105 (-) Transcript_95266:254-568(-)